MKNLLNNLGAYNKALAAGLGSLITVVLALLGFTAVLPTNVAGWLLTFVGLATPVVTFLVRNQANIDRIGDDLAGHL